VAAVDLAAVTAQLRDVFAAPEPYRDAGVEVFGLANAVLEVGDTFLEVVSPVREGTAAGRYLDRQGGDCGYMAMVQVPDADAARARLAELGVRVVWDHAEPDPSVGPPDVIDLHLHPRDLPGTLLALDETRPTGSWRWGGPAWAGAVPPHRAGGIRGLTVAVSDPAAAAERWAAVLGVEPHGTRLVLGGSEVRFVEPDRREGIVGLTVARPDAVPTQVEIAGVAIEIVPADA
jgi:catechol 2,3-dioxygenase-like lactoylglutathione lyase family enzyme